MPGDSQRLPALRVHACRGAAQEAIQAGLLGASARQRLEGMPGALRQGYATSDLAARVAAVAAAHELAKLCGRVPGGAPASPDDRAAAGEAAAAPLHACLQRHRSTCASQAGTTCKADLELRHTVASACAVGSPVHCMQLNTQARHHAWASHGTRQEEGQ